MILVFYFYYSNINKTGILYKADPDLDPEPQKKRTQYLWNKRTLYQNSLYELKNSFLTNSRVLIENSSPKKPK